MLLAATAMVEATAVSGGRRKVVAMMKPNLPFPDPAAEQAAIIAATQTTLGQVKAAMGIAMVVAQ